MNNGIKFFAQFLFCLFYFSISSQAKFSALPVLKFPAHSLFNLSSQWDWKTLETEHFKIHFPSELSQISQKAAFYLEEAHFNLSPLFQWTPNYKVQVLIVDNADQSNGAALATARVGLILWVTPPDSWSSLSYYDDWLRLLIFHEYTHLLNMDTTLGFWKPLRYIFGDFFLPNSFWYRWMLEGFAIYIETKFSKGGRGRSPYYSLLLRSSIEENQFGNSNFIPLSRMNISNPYFPGGDVAYQFGYHLMNEAAQNNPNKKNALGDLSYNSAFRIPFFINGNLENTIGKDWDQIWDEWIQKTSSRVLNDLKIIQSHPTTPYKILIENNYSKSNQATGNALSPDGKWLAYSFTSTDRRPGLFIKNLETHETKRLGDKLSGVSFSFTPDSKHFVYNEINRQGQFSQWSDLKAYSIDQDKIYFLSDKKRLKDPHISLDGKWITFTITDHGKTGLAQAPLILTKNKLLELGTIEILFMPELFDRVSNPYFSHDQKKIFFSFHKNQILQEDIQFFDLDHYTVQTLVSDGFMNRFPIEDYHGQLYFISNKTGSDNLYRFNNKKTNHPRVTHFTTAIDFPKFSSTSPKLIASIFNYSGWNLSEISFLDLKEQPLIPQMSATDAPEQQTSLFSAQNFSQSSETSYSPLPSLIPRLWSPVFSFDGTGLALGGVITGWDAIDQHRYFTEVDYSFLNRSIDGILYYSNRSYGAAFDFTFQTQSSLLTQKYSYPNTYSKDYQTSLGIRYPFLWTYSSLTPKVSFGLDRTFTFTNPSSTSANSLVVSSPYTFFYDFSSVYTDAQTYPLSGRAERGRTIVLGTRLFSTKVPLLGEQVSAKWIAQIEENFSLGNHHVLTPKIKVAGASASIDHIPSSSARIQGRFAGQANSQSFSNLFGGSNFDYFFLRGYTGLNIQASFLNISSLDYYFPISQIFKGWGTYPIFFHNVYGFIFTESAYLPQAISNHHFLPSAGGGIQLMTEVWLLPLILSFEFHHGFSQKYQGSSDFVINLKNNL